MRIAVVVAGAVLIAGSLAGVAAAQPGQTQPQLPPPQQQVPPPYMYQPAPPPLTLEERQLLEDGEISDGQYIGGGLLSIFPGFGIGQAVQGRWSDRGYIFTLGETAAMGLVIYGISKNDCFLAIDPCHDDSDGVGELLVGLLAYTGFRIWEIVDAWAVPPSHNRRVQNLRLRLGYPQQGYGTVGSVGFDF